MADIKPIPEGWIGATLRDAIFPVSETFNFKDTECIHFLNTWDISNGKLLHWNFSQVSSLPGQAKKKFQKWDILYSEIRPENKRFMLVDFDSENSVASTKLMVLRTREGIDRKFIYQYLTSEDTIRDFQMTAESRSGTFPQITFDAISYFPLSLPPLLEQQAIARMLSSFDDKIELLREQNETLEKTAQTIFHEWFGKYGVEDKLPEGWRMGKLGEIAEITSWKRPWEISERITNTHQIPLIWASKIMGYTENYLFDGKTIVIGRVWTHGEVQKFNEKIHPSDNTLVIKSNNFVFVYLILKGLDYGKMNRGAVQPLITQTDLKNSPIIIPTDTIFNAFNKATNAIFNKIENNDSQIQSLSKTRDELLPKLISGEIRLSA